MEKSTILTVFLAALISLMTVGPAFAAEGQKVVNVNEADASQLALLPRVGPALAGRIIEFRDANGKFKAAEDLILVRGIGDKTFELLEPFVAISGKTTLTEKVKVSDLQRQKQEAEEGSDG